MTTSQRVGMKMFLNLISYICGAIRIWIREKNQAHPIHGLEMRGVEIHGELFGSIHKVKQNGPRLADFAAPKPESLISISKLLIFGKMMTNTWQIQIHGLNFDYERNGVC